MSAGDTRADASALMAAVEAGDFSLMRGGPTCHFVRTILRATSGLRAGVTMAALVFVASFVPLLVLTWSSDTLLAGRVDVPLSADWFVMARFVVALPLLVLGADLSDRLLRSSMRQFRASGVVGSAAAAGFADALACAARWRDALLPELLCLLIAIAPVLLSATAIGVAGIEGLGRTTWKHDAGGALSGAALWLRCVSAPLFRFVLLLWLWRLLLWTGLLLRVSRLPLDLRASHADGAGGLAFLGLAQSRFAILSAVGGVLVSGYCLNQMMHAGKSAHELRYLIGGYVGGSTLLLLVPLLLMTPAMARAKRDALQAYGVLGHAMARAFESQWRHRAAVADVASSTSEIPHLSAMADFGNVHDKVRTMALVPVARWNVMRLAVAAAAPFAPIACVAMSLDELAQRLFHILV